MHISRWRVAVWLLVPVIAFGMAPGSASAQSVTEAGKSPPQTEAFFAAIQRGDTEKVREFLHGGVSPNLRNKKGITALQRAVVANNNSVPIAALLIEKGADVNAQSPQAGATPTPLAVAAHWGAPDLVRLLIAKGADVNARGSDGSTPLMWAAHFRDIEAMKILIQNRADVNATTTDKATALHWALGGSSSLMVVRLLLESGANPNAKDKSGTSPLQIAMNMHVQGYVELLKRFGAR